MDIEFSQIHEMVYMHDIVNSDSKKKPRIPLKKFLNAENVLTQTTSWTLKSRYVNVNSVNKVNVKSKVKNSYISRSVNDEGNDSNLLIVFYVQIMPDDFVMQLHRF